MYGKLTLTKPKFKKAFYKYIQLNVKRIVPQPRAYLGLNNCDLWCLVLFIYLFQSFDNL